MGTFEILGIAGSTFVLMFLAELADKTQIVIFSLGLKYKAPLKVFSGALLAHGIMDGVAIALGSEVSKLISIHILRDSIGVIFVLIGLFYFFYKKKENEKEFLPKGHAFLASFGVVFLAEFGDKTQIASGLLAAQFNSPVVVFAAAMAALALVIGLNITIGNRVAEKINLETVKKISALLFIVFGAIFIIF